MNNLDKDQTVEPSVDIFNTHSPVKQGSETSTIKAETHEVEPKHSGLIYFVSKLNLVHYGAALAIAAVIWVVCPYLFNHSQPARSSNILELRKVMANADAAPPQQFNTVRTPQTDLAGKASNSTAINLPSSASATALVPAAVSESAAQQDEIQALRATLDELQHKVELAEKQSTKCQAAASTMMIAMNNLKPKPHQAYRMARHHNKKVLPKLRNFTLNTIYSNQAWIQNSDQTYVVQIGDVIDGLRIMQIDPVARQVITSHGVIR